MAPRLNKRQQRELEELSTLSGTGLPVAPESSGEDPPEPPSGARFAAVGSNVGSLSTKRPDYKLAIQSGG